MIGITHNIRAVRAELLRLPVLIDRAMDEALDDELTALQGRCEGMTPIVTGAMRGGYGVRRSRMGLYELEDLAFREGNDGGRFYAPWVVWGTARSKDNPALREELDINAERDLTRAVDVKIRVLSARVS